MAIAKRRNCDYLTLDGPFILSMKKIISLLMATWLGFAATLEVFADSSIAWFQGTRTPDSTVRIKGTSNVHNWELRGAIGGFIWLPADLENTLNQLSTSEKLAVKSGVSIWVAGLKSETSMFTPKSDERAISELLKSGQHPYISYWMTELVATGVGSSSNAVRVFDSKGELVIAGVTNQIAMPINIAALDGNTLKFSGRVPIKMTDFDITPPAAKGSNFIVTVGDEVEVVFDWIVKDRKKEQTEKEIALVQQLHKEIEPASRETSEAEMKAYTNTVSVPDRGRFGHPYLSGTNAVVVTVMVPIKGGEFMMGSPESEADRHADEGPQHRVRISPFWMQQCEITWDEYLPFMLNIEEAIPKTTNDVSQLSDAVSKPSRPYVDMSFGMGKAGYPAIAMTQHAANKYCEWLSAKTGHFYRLPTEAEWEYACRAGTTNAYSFGDDRAKLPGYAWFYENSYSKYQKVGRKKPNPWGLYDMHGNVAEWCLDQYDPTFYLQQADAPSVNPWNKATQPYPHVVRGGSWNDDPEQLRSAARAKSDKSWKTDPTLPPTFWYMDQAQIVGFRMVRPLKVPTADEMYHYWNSGVENEMPPRW